MSCSSQGVCELDDGELLLELIQLVGCCYWCREEFHSGMMVGKKVNLYYLVLAGIWINFSWFPPVEIIAGTNWVATLLVYDFEAHDNSCLHSSLFQGLLLKVIRDLSDTCSGVVYPGLPVFGLFPSHCK